MATEIMDSEKLRILANDIRKSIIEMGYLAGKKGAHFGGALSAVEILVCLYNGIMDISPDKAGKNQRDIFIAGKAHCVLAFYAVLAQRGFFSKKELLNFEENGSYLSGHPVIKEEWGIETSGGSLGMGISQGIGIALFYKQKKYDNSVFVLMGDGECDEGSIWEGAMSAAHYNLDNLIIIVDKNGLQYDGNTEDIMNLDDLSAKFASFGFSVHEVDGHNINDLYDTLLSAVDEKNAKPKVIIADTVKGKGISFMENKAEWHHGILKEDLYKRAMSELDGGICIENGSHNA